ncbi:hypothetical protein MUN88_09170 [Gracilibacillus caseinilyticus]|uniref:Phosphatidate cytidylyltransferase n=1 Tax=Gracilibacillus caseinilyticus TaxID=2932256 RepID=A0ABY4F2V6_9BACI|nr:hypothetical protein [Gracilibacillus caseinilyticus]UOQ50204.1 hypothetical protein MUN88_09170 [Gracilibacillus caseinilyticus]
MNKKAETHEVMISFFCISLALIVLAWQYHSVLLWVLALTSLSVNFFMEAFKEWKLGRPPLFFSQQLFRGLGLLGIAILLFFV